MAIVSSLTISKFHHNPPWPLPFDFWCCYSCDTQQTLLDKKKVTHVQKPHGDIIDDIVTNLDIANQTICYEAYKYIMAHPKNLS
jgi:hypothetical protein